MLVSLETHIRTCYFQGGGGVSEPPMLSLEEEIKVSSSPLDPLGH